MPFERRNLPRRVFSYYIRVLDDTSGQPLGHLADISIGGFRLDTLQALPINRDYRLRIDLTPDIAHKSFMVFTARSKWCQVDPIDPTLFNVGFQITNMTPGDYEIFTRMFEKYGTPSPQETKRKDDYLWK